MVKPETAIRYMAKLGVLIITTLPGQVIANELPPVTPYNFLVDGHNVVALPLRSRRMIVTLSFKPLTNDSSFTKKAFIEGGTRAAQFRVIRKGTAIFCGKTLNRFTVVDPLNKTRHVRSPLPNFATAFDPNKVLLSQKLFISCNHSNCGYFGVADKYTYSFTLPPTESCMYVLYSRHIEKSMRIFLDIQKSER